MKLPLALAMLCFVSAALAVTVSNSALRDPKQAAAFRKLHPCPAGPDAGSTRRCAGYVIDHIKPLCAGGIDGPVNMMYMTVADGKKKDAVERELCQCLGTVK